MVETNPSNYYFAYGRNLSAECLEKRIGSDFDKVGVAILPDHRLTFDAGNIEWGTSSWANVRPDLNNKVYGYLYRFKESNLQFSLLDEYEGYFPSNPEGSAYLRETVTVILLPDFPDESSPQEIKAQIYSAGPGYVMDVPNPPEEYIDVIKTASKVYGFFEHNKPYLVPYLKD